MSAHFYVCPVPGLLPWKVVDTCGPNDETLCLCETQEKADLIAANMERCSNQDAEKWKQRGRSGVLPAVEGEWSNDSTYPDSCTNRWHLFRAPRIVYPRCPDCGGSV